MKALNLPPSWNRMGFTARAGYLCSTHQARDYSDACSKLGQMVKEKEAEYKEQFANPYEAAARGYVDEVIRPSQTRIKVMAALDMLRNKVDKLPRKKHGNIPL